MLLFLFLAFLLQVVFTDGGRLRPLVLVPASGLVFRRWREDSIGPGDWVRFLVLGLIWDLGLICNNWLFVWDFVNKKEVVVFT